MHKDVAALDPFNQLAAELRELAGIVVERSELETADLRRVLSFVAKVSHVVEQCLRDLLVLLIQIKHLDPRTLNSEIIRRLKMEVDLLTVRSRYRDAEEICSRLHHLSDQYNTEIEPLLVSIAPKNAWMGLFGLLEEHEGRLIMLVQRVTRQVQEKLQTIKLPGKGRARKDPQTLELIDYASDEADRARAALNTLRELANRILGLSGSSGLLELTDFKRNRKQASVILNKGHIDMGDKYEVGQAGAVGPHSQASNITFNQIWNKSSQNTNLPQLAQELAELRKALGAKATEADHYVALGEVASAEKSAEKGDGPQTLKHLAAAGKWVWSTASKIGIGVATAAVLEHLGLK